MAYRLIPLSAGHNRTTYILIAEQKSVKLFIVTFYVVKFGKDTTSKLHQRVSVRWKCEGLIMLTLAKQTPWFGLSRGKQESPSPKCCSPAIAVLPAMQGQSA